MLYPVAVATKDLEILSSLFWIGCIFRKPRCPVTNAPLRVPIVEFMVNIQGSFIIKSATAAF